MNWKTIVIWLIMCVGLFLFGLPSYGGEWQLIKSNWRTKEFVVSGTLTAVGTAEISCGAPHHHPEKECESGMVDYVKHEIITNYPGYDFDDESKHGYVPPGVTAGEVSITIAGAWTVNIGSAYDGSHMCWFATTYSDKVLVYQTAVAGDAFSASANFEVKLSGPADLYGQYEYSSGSKECPSNIMNGSVMKMKDTLVNPTLTIKIGNQSETFLLPMETSSNYISIRAIGTSPLGGLPAAGSDGKVSIPLEVNVGSTDGAYNQADTKWVDCSYSRSFAGVAEKTQTYKKEDTEAPGTIGLTTQYYPLIFFPWFSKATYASTVSVGGGHVSVAGGYRNAALDSWGPSQGSDGYYHGGRHETAEMAMVDYSDNCGAYDINYSNPIANLDGAVRSGVMVTSDYERHRWSDDAYLATAPALSFADSGSVHYGGFWTCNSTAGSGMYKDMNIETGLTGEDNYFTKHGGLAIKNVEALGEPSHPSWEPFSSDPQLKWADDKIALSTGQGGGNGLTLSLCGPIGSIPGYAFNFRDPIAGWVASDCSFAQDANGLTGTTTSQASRAIPAKIVLNTDQCLPLNKRLTGTRFANVHWEADVNNAEADLNIGGHTWRLTGGPAGPQESMIDLCMPNASSVQGGGAQKEVTRTATETIESSHGMPGIYTYTVAPEDTKVTKYQLHFEKIDLGPCDELRVFDENGKDLGLIFTQTGTDYWYPYWFDAKRLTLQLTVYDMGEGGSYGFKIDKYQYSALANMRVSVQQSIANYELPDDAPVSPGSRNPAASYDWEFPAGWGIGRIKDISFSMNTPNTSYVFKDIQLYRKKPEEGGFANLYVLPHQPAWNDTQDQMDFAWNYSGSNIFGFTRYDIKKAWLVIDGAVVLEVPAGHCEYNGDSDFPYIMALQKLNNPFPCGDFAYPLDDYLDAAGYAANGVARIIQTAPVDAPNASPKNFNAQNCYTTFLAEGVYTEVDDPANPGQKKIDVPFIVQADAIWQMIGMGSLSLNMHKTFRGGLQGLLFDSDGKSAAGKSIRITTPDASPGQRTDIIATTNSLGWFDVGMPHGSGSLNTKGPAVLQTDLGMADVALRNRYVSRLVIGSEALLDNSACEIIDVGPNPIEPAYGDTVDIGWRSSDTLSPSHILVLQSDTSGSIIGSEDRTYRLIAELDPGPATDNPAMLPYRYSGTTHWTPTLANLPGRYYVGIQYADGHVQTKWGNDYWPGFNIAISVYDVNSDEYAPFYPGGGGSQNNTSISYNLSASVPKCKINVAGAELVGPGCNTDINSVKWDGIVDGQSGTYCNTGIYSIAVTPDSLDPNKPAGLPLSICSITASGPSTTQPNAFDPQSGEHIEISYRIVEPVKRMQADAAYITARVYNANAEMVRILKDAEETRSIDNDGNDATATGGNILVWDGKNDAGMPAEPGGYSITIFAKDNAGVGCESRIATVDVQLLTSQVCTIQANIHTDSGQRYIMGSTNSGNSVSWTDSVDGIVVKLGTCDLDEVGNFSFTLTDSTPGLHTIALTTANQQTTETAQQTLSELINNISVSAPTTSPGSAPMGEVGRFSPIQGQSVSVELTSQIADSFDVEIIDPFDSSTCINSVNPARASDFFNGSIHDRIIKTWNVNLAGPGRVSITWDGTYGNSVPVPAGPYIVRISRSNSDGLLAASFDKIVAVDGSGTPPAVSNINTCVNGMSVALSWQTNVKTTGCVVYSSYGMPMAKAQSNDLSNFHIVYLPITEPGTTYSYWVLATDDAGNTSVSQKGTVTTGDGEAFSDITVAPVSDTCVDIQWTSSTDAVGKVEFVVVGPAVNNLNWQSVGENVATQDHVVHLTGLSTNSEYVFRVVSASDSTFAKANASQYLDFITKTSLPSLHIDSPSENAFVSGTINVKVTASDAVARFSTNGISNVELSVDNITMSASNPSFGSNEYDFTLDTSQLSKGLHRLTVFATDDFWNTATYTIDIYVTDSGGAARMSLAREQALGGMAASGTNSGVVKGHVVAKRVDPIEYYSGSYNGSRVWVVFCRAEFDKQVRKGFRYRFGGEPNAPSNWVTDIISRDPNRVCGAINGGFFGDTSLPSGSNAKVQGYLREFGNTHYGIDPDPGKYRWCFGMHELGSWYYVDKLYGTFVPPAKWNKFEHGRSNVGVVLLNGSDKKCPYDKSGVVSNTNEADTRSTVAWSTDSAGRRHFFLVAFECESWKGVKSFFSKGGGLNKILKKQFRISGVDIDTVIWLDGSTSTELAYQLRRNNAIKKTDDGPRASHGRVYSKYITDFVGVWSPL